MNNRYKFFHTSAEEYTDYNTLVDMIKYIINQFDEKEKEKTLTLFETSWSDEDTISFIEEQGYSVQRDFILEEIIADNEAHKILI
jgi:hypothetical protein